jgi:hypothetical protein
MRVAIRKLRIEDAAKLQALVVENFDAIEPGLTVLDARLLLGHATIDVIGVDAVGALVLAAVGFSANEEMLMKAVEAYSWCLEYPEALVRLYPSCQVSEDRPPRLLFVVERMPDAFHRKIKQLGFPEVDCVEFRHLEFDGVPAVYFESLLRLRRAVVPASARMVDPDSLTGPATENVITMNGAAARANGAKIQKLLTPTSPEAPTSGPRAAERVVPSREPAPVVSMVSRQAVVTAPWTERPRPAEPVMLREPEPLIAEPVVEALVAAEPAPIASLAEAVETLELSIEPEATIEPVTLLEIPDPPARPVLDAVPAMAPAHVLTATAPAPERVSFKDLATALLGATTATQAALNDAVATAATAPPLVEPLVLEDAVEPLDAESIVTAPLELMLESRIPEPVEESTLVVPAVVIEESVKPVEPPALALESAPAAPAAAPRERAATDAKPASPALPQGFEGLKFPNDGVLTRQWIEFLSQMSAAK